MDGLQRGLALHLLRDLNGDISQILIEKEDTGYAHLRPVLGEFEKRNETVR